NLRLPSRDLVRQGRHHGCVERLPAVPAAPHLRARARLLHQGRTQRHPHVLSTRRQRHRVDAVSDPRALVQKLWNYCNVLRDDGLSYGDYVEQLTYLLFLKMADEQTRPPFNRDAVVPYGLDWQSLLDRDGDELEAHYIK